MDDDDVFGSGAPAAAAPTTGTIPLVGLEDQRKVVEKSTDIARQIIENLRGDALSVAMEVGVDKLFVENGARGLMDAMVAHIFPVARHESKALYREGHQTHEGVLLRHQGESMQSFSIRRKR